MVIMPTPPAILNKVKLLLRLATSPNPHEAESARKLAEGLIDKHGITPEELESLKDPKPLYSEEEKIFSTIGIVSWRRQLALAIGKHFGCQIVEEELVPAEGPHPFHYYGYGEPEDVEKVKLAFTAFAHQVEHLIDTQCLVRGPVYIDSYTEGVTDAIKQNILMFGIDLPEKRKTISPTKKDAVTMTGDAITKPERPQPAERHVDVHTGSMVKDIMAYFKGVEDGKDLFLDDLLELAEDTKEPKEIDR